MQSIDLEQLFRNDPNVVELQGGETIFEEGDPKGAMYVVLAGSVDLSIDDEVFDTAEQGDIIGEMSMIEEKPRSATALAIGPTRLAVIGEERFESLISEYPAFSMYVMRALARRLRSMDQHVHD